MGANFPTAGVSLLSLAFVVPEEDVSADPQSSHSHRLLLTLLGISQSRGVSPVDPLALNTALANSPGFLISTGSRFSSALAFLECFLGVNGIFAEVLGVSHKPMLTGELSLEGSRPQPLRSLCNLLLVCGGLDENAPQRRRDLHTWSPVTGAVGKAVEPLSVYGLTSLPASFRLMFASPGHCLPLLL